MSGSCSWFPLDRDEIDAWIERHRDDLPQTLDELSRYPIPFRKAIVFAVPSDVRVALWREHLNSFLGPNTSLTDEQQAAVRYAIAEMPGIVGGAPGEGLPRARLLTERVRPLFSREQGFLIFASLGPPEPPEGLPIPADALPSSTG